MARQNVPLGEPTVSLEEAKMWARANGLKGERGGWLRTASGTPLCQGYEALRRYMTAALERSRDDDPMLLTLNRVWLTRIRWSVHRA